jgi:hypothetical protein
MWRTGNSLRNRDSKPVTCSCTDCAAAALEGIWRCSKICKCISHQWRRVVVRPDLYRGSHTCVSHGSPAPHNRAETPACWNEHRNAQQIENKRKSFSTYFHFARQSILVAISPLFRGKPLAFCPPYWVQIVYSAAKIWFWFRRGNLTYKTNVSTQHFSSTAAQKCRYNWQRHSSSLRPVRITSKSPQKRG